MLGTYKPFPGAGFIDSPLLSPRVGWVPIYTKRFINDTIINIGGLNAEGIYRLLYAINPSSTSGQLGLEFNGDQSSAYEYIANLAGGNGNGSGNAGPYKLIPLADTALTNQAFCCGEIQFFSVLDTATKIVLFSNGAAFKNTNAVLLNLAGYYNAGLTNNVAPLNSVQILPATNQTNVTLLGTISGTVILMQLL